MHPDAEDTVVLLTSETVTNAFLHGRSEARITVIPRGDGLLVEVGDDDPRGPQQPEQRPGAVSGRGLLILEALADHWGVTDDGTGKVVWFEVCRIPSTG